MATNEKYRVGDHVSLPVPAGMKAGDPVRLGALNGVLATDRARTDVAPTLSDGTRNPDYNYGGGNPNGFASVWLDGGHEFTVAFAVTAVGSPVYIVADESGLFLAASGSQVYGHALTTKGAGSGGLVVRISNKRPA